MSRREEWDEAGDDQADTTGMEAVLCSGCNGSGEGMTERSRCWACGGSGEVLVECEPEGEATS